MKTFIKATLLSTSLIATAAFAGAEFHPSTYTTYVQHDAHRGEVNVLHGLPKDELSYTEIGMVRISSDQVSDYYEALEAIKSAAARHGGNAIVLADDAKLFMSGGLTDRGTSVRNISAIAVIQH